MGHDWHIMTITWLEHWRPILAWGAAGIGIVAVCILATFPYGMLQARLVAELNRATGMEVRVADWSMGIPLSLEWRNVTLSKPNVHPIELAVIQAKLGVFKALVGSLGLDVVIQLDAQSSQTSLAKASVTAPSFSSPGPFAIKGQLQQVDLPTLIRGYVTRGTLNGNFSHRVDSGQSSTDLMKGEGTWAAEATDLVVDQIPVGSGRFLSLTFSSASARVSCRDLLCDVTELKGEGIDGSFTGEGSMTLQQPIANSQLGLTVTVVPGPGFAAKAGSLNLPSPPPGTPITLKIMGTLAQARITL